MATPKLTPDLLPIDSPHRPARAGRAVPIFTVDPALPVAEGITEVTLSRSASGVFSATIKKVHRVIA